MGELAGDADQIHSLKRLTQLSTNLKKRGGQ